MSRLLSEEEEPKVATKTIRISDELYEYLLKQRSLQRSFDGVLRKLIKIEKEKE